MKPFEKRIRIFLCFVFLVGFLSTNAVCSAQDELKKTSKSSRKTPVVVEQSSEQKFDVMFEKPISVEDFATYLRNKTDNKVNIVVAKNARKVMIPPIELKQVSFYSALKAMQVATQKEVFPISGHDAFIEINRDPNLAKPLDKESATSVRVFNVSRIVDKNKDAESSMLSAIEIGLEMSNSSPENVNMKFHKETKLLFIRASRSDLDVVMQVIDQIGAGLSNSRGMDDFGG